MGKSTEMARKKLITLFNMSANTKKGKSGATAEYLMQVETKLERNMLGNSNLACHTEEGRILLQTAQHMTGNSKKRKSMETGRLLFKR